jgi:Peptidase S46
MKVVRLSRMAGLFLLLLLTVALPWSVRGDEGMWAFNRLPVEQLKTKYGFDATPAWAEHLRSSSVRFNNGGSGSFVSRDGLIMTNHHVGADTLSKLSTATKDYYRDGFAARNLAEEARAPDLELNVLVGIENVTDRVNRFVSLELDDQKAAEVRRRAIAEIEKEATDKNGLRNDVVALYQGGQYHLYTYKKYTDVRLVFAPEFDIAFFGGDPDNFEYPRYDLDVCFFRAYEEGKPAKIEHFLKWGRDGSKQGDLIFVAGHPGHTDRLNTIASLEYLRDVELPLRLTFLKAREAFLLDYGRRSEDASRQSKEDFFTVQNSRKARIGGWNALRDEVFMKGKTQADKDLHARIERSTYSVKDRRVAAWGRIAAAEQVAARIAKPYFYLERAYAFQSRLFEIARYLVRLAAEQAKPNSERLEEYRESALKSLELKLFSDAPIYPEYEEAQLAHSLSLWKTVMPDEPIIERVLHGRSPEDVARDIVRGTKLADISFRHSLASGGSNAIAACDDPMIKLALAVDADARAVRKIHEEQVEGVERANYSHIAQALFQEKGETIYPDATFTLRLSYGVVAGYSLDGKAIPAYTTIGEAFAHAQAHDNKPPYELPKSWIQAKESGRLRLETPLNFVSTADIIGGNSGSPVVNRNNEIVGLIFDGNIQSLILDYGYDDKVARAVAVDSRAIIEALKSIYFGDRLVKELLGEQ